MNAEARELPPPTRTPLAQLGYVGKRALSMEWGVWASLFRILTIRPRVPKGSTPFTYDRQSRTVLIAFIALSAIEIPIVDLIVHQWSFIRWPLLIFGIWGLTFMVGILLGFITRPHAVGPSGMRFRMGPEFELALDWEDVASVAGARGTTVSSKAFVLIEEAGGLVLALPHHNLTNIEVELERPVEVRIHFQTHSIHTVRAWLDDPTAYLDAVRRELAPPETVESGTRRPGGA